MSVLTLVRPDRVASIVVGACLGAALTATLAAGDAPAPLAWSDAGEFLSGAAQGISLGVVAPDGTRLIVGMPDRGLWASDDGGKRWTQLGKDQAALAKGRPHQLIFDPADPAKWWLGSRGPGGGLFTSADGGTTVTRLTNLEAIGGIGIDFSDPKRKTVIACQYDKDHGVQRSVNGGTIFTHLAVKPGDKEKLLPIDHVLVLDAKTLVAATGEPDLETKKGKDREPGILRSEDGGATWTNVGKQSAAAPPLQLANGQILWPYGLDDGLLRSFDKGRTWLPLDAPIKSCPCEMPKGWLLGVGERQLYVSTNNGKLWEALGAPLPFAPGGIAYAAKLHCVFAWRPPELSGKEALMRLDLPEDPGQIVQVVAARDVMVWNGDEAARGGGWMWPKDPPMVMPALTNEVVRQGKGALKLHAAGGNAATFGWNWCSWFPSDSGTDISGMKTLLLAMRIDGASKPDSVRIVLQCSSTKKPSKEAVLVTIVPTLADGAWHEVAVPLAELIDGTEFDAKKAWEFDLSVSGKAALDTDVYIDEVGFAK